MAKKVLTVVGAVAGFVVGGPAGLFVGASIGNSIGNSIKAISTKPPKVSPATTERLTVSVDPRAPRAIVFGRTALATDLRDQEYSTGQDYLHRFLVTAAHRVSAYREIWFDDKLAWTAESGVQGDFAGYLTVTPIAEGSAANAINIGPRMGSSRRYTGLGYVHLRYKLTGNSKKTDSPFAQSVPSRVTIVGDGAPVYDPRLDSSAGGNGPQRANDQATWAWNVEAARNPALQLLWYLLGWRIKNPATGEWRLSVGKGIPANRIDLASFITAANLCDEPVARSSGGTEPRYRSDGIFTEGDDPGTVTDTLKAAMNAELDDVDGKIRVTVLHDDLAVPVASFSEDDVLGDFRWEPSTPLQDTLNVVRGGYTDASSAALFQMIDYPEQRIASADGIDRIDTFPLPTVQSASQAQRLAKIRLQRRLNAGTFTAAFQATAWKVQRLDLIHLTYAPLGWDVPRKFRVVDADVRVDGVVNLVLRIEHPSNYAWDGSDAAPIAAAPMNSYAPQLAPVVQAFDELADSVGAVELAIDLKSRIFWQGTPPLAAESSEGDRWVDTDGGNAEYRRIAGSGNTDYGGTTIVYGTTRVIYPPWAPASDGRVAMLGDQVLAALDQIGRIQADGWLSAGEKPEIVRRRTDAIAERAGLIAKAVAQGTSTTAYQGAYDSLITYLAGLSPPIDDTDSDTRIVPGVFNAAFAGYYLARTNLQTASGDITAANQVVVTVPATYSVDANYLGAPNSGALPIRITPRVTRGGVDIRAANDTSCAITAVNVTASVNTTNGDQDKGVVTVTAMSANSGYLDLVVTAAGIAQPACRVRFEKRLGDAPAPGGSTAKSASDGQLDAISSTSFVAITDVLTVGLAAGERLVGTASLDYTVEGSGFQVRTASAKWQYSPAGANTWSDFAAAIAGSQATSAGRVGAATGYYVDAEAGHVDVAQAKSGLSAGAWDTRIVAALDAAGRSVSFAGTALIEAKP